MQEEDPEFKFPTQLLRQIKECSNGFLLIMIDENHQFRVYRSIDNQVGQLAMANFVEIFGQQIQQELRDTSHTEEEDEDEGPSFPT